MASIEPATKQANRGRAADAVGNAIAADALTRRAARADTQQASIAPAIQLLPAFVCGVGSVCVKTHWVGNIAQAHDVATSGGSPQRASRASTRRSVAAARSGA